MSLNNFLHLPGLTNHFSKILGTDLSEDFLTLFMATIQIILILKFLIQIINWIINFLLNLSQILLNFLEFLALFFRLWLNFVKIFGCLIYKIFQIFFLNFNFLNEILCIFDNKSCLLDLLAEELTLKSLIFLL